MAEPDILGVFSVMGFSFSGAAPNQGIVFASLKPFDERKGAEHSASAVDRPRAAQADGDSRRDRRVDRAGVDSGLSRFGGFEFQVLDQTGTDISTLAGGAYGVMGAAAQSPLLQGVFTTFTANDPQLLVSIDRQRALAAGLPLGEITSAMQTFLGSSYVNDFQFNNRAYRVYVQADKQFRASPQNIKQMYARSRTGQMVPLDSRRDDQGDRRAAGHRALQPLPVGDAERIADAGRELGRRAEGDGADRHRDAAARG